MDEDDLFLDYYNASFPSDESDTDLVEILTFDPFSIQKATKVKAEPVQAIDPSLIQLNPEPPKLNDKELFDLFVFSGLLVPSDDSSNVSSDSSTTSDDFFYETADSSNSSDSSLDSIPQVTTANPKSPTIDSKITDSTSKSKSIRSKRKVDRNAQQQPSSKRSKSTSPEHDDFYSKVNSDELKNISSQLHYALKNIHPSTDFEKFRLNFRLKRLVHQTDESATITRHFYNRPNFLNEVTAGDRFRYLKNPSFNLRNTPSQYYDPQYYKVEIDSEGKEISATKQGLCPYCSTLNFFTLKNSSYNLHLGNLHGIGTKGFICPDPIYHGTYSLAKGETGDKRHSSKQYNYTQREKLAVVCPCCFLFFDVHEEDQDCKYKTYLRHYREHHLQK